MIIFQDITNFFLLLPLVIRAFLLYNQRKCANNIKFPLIIEVFLLYLQRINKIVVLLTCKTKLTHIEICRRTNAPFISS